MTDNGQRIFGRSRKYKRGVVGEFADTDRGFGQDADARTCSKNRDRSLEKSRPVSGSGRPWPRGTGQREPEVMTRRSFCGTVLAKFGSQELVALIRQGPRSHPMRTFVFVCPNTGRPVPASLPDEAFEDPDTYHSIECIVCADVHLVNPTTGRILRPGEE